LEKAQKEVEISSLQKRFSTAKIAILTSYSGMKVEQMTQLRAELRKEGAGYKVVKNTLAKIACKGTDFEGLHDHFKGTIGMAYSEADPVAPAKILKKYSQDEEIPLSVIIAHMDGRLLAKGELDALADLPSREELLAKLAGSMLAPAQNMVQVLAAVPRQVVTVLAALRDKKEQETK